MVAVRPADVIDEILHWHVDDGGAGVWRQCCEGAEELDVGAAARSGFAIALADITVAKIVDQVVGDFPGVAGADSFGIVTDDVACG